MTEREVLEGAFDAIVSLTTAVKALGSAREQRHDAPANALDGDGSRVVAANENDPGDKHASEDPANHFLSTETAPGNESSREARGWRRARGEPDRSEMRVPASEILRLLRAGAIEDYRRASPALTATCMYREFAQGLGEVVHDGGNVSRGGWESKVEENAHDRELKRVDRGPDSAFTAESDSGGRGEASDLGLTKAEFCEFFEAVTDLVDLNGLSLVRNRPS